MAKKSVQAQRVLAYNFDLTGRGEASGEVSLTSTPILPGPTPFVGRDGRRYSYDIDQLNASIRANGADIPVFIDHMPGKAYGWLDHTQPLQPSGDGYELATQYTEEGAALIASKAYRYNSPTYWAVPRSMAEDNHDYDIVGLLESSLVNLPNLQLRALNSADGGAYTVEIDSPDESTEMTKELLEALGLPEDADTAAAVAAVNTLKAAAERAAAITTAAGAAADADAEAVVEAAANSRVAAGAYVARNVFDEAVTAKNAAEKALADYKAEQHEAAVQAAITAACTNGGPLTPAQAEKLTAFARNDLEGFRAYIATLPAHAAANNGVATQSMSEGAGLPASTLEMLAKLRIDPKFVPDDNN